VPVAILGTVGVGSGALDHGRIQVETGHVEPVLASQQDRQAAGSATHLDRRPRSDRPEPTTHRPGLTLRRGNDQSPVGQILGEGRVEVGRRR